MEFTIVEVAALCGVSRRTVLNWIDEDKFPGAHFLYDSPKMGYLIPASDLLPFVTRSNPMIVPKVTKLARVKEEEMSAAS